VEQGRVPREAYEKLLHFLPTHHPGDEDIDLEDRM
jgi:hypothetical protein